MKKWEKLDKYLKRSGFSKQDFIVLIRVNQSISDLVKRGFNLNGTLQFRIGSLNKQLRQWSFVCVCSISQYYNTRFFGRKFSKKCLKSPSFGLFSKICQIRVFIVVLPREIRPPPLGKILDPPLLVPNKYKWDTAGKGGLFRTKCVSLGRKKWRIV